MDILLIILGIILGGFTAFLTSIYTSLPIDKLNSILAEKNKATIRLQKLRAHSDESLNSFLILEILFYGIVFIACGRYISYNFESWLFILYAIIILLPVTIIFRAILFSLGKRYAGNLAKALFPIFSIITFIISPVSIFMNYLNSKSGVNNEEASREELNAMVETAREEGSIEPEEYRILKNIMHLKDVIVSDVMTPRTVVFSCEADKTVSEVIDLPEL
ncbi:MAG: CNNM domain-containing protein, partial [FCB group bacterium]